MEILRENAKKAKQVIIVKLRKGDIRINIVIFFNKRQIISRYHYMTKTTNVLF